MNLRGCGWQLLLFLLSATFFGIVLLLRTVLPIDLADQAPETAFVTPGDSFPDAPIPAVAPLSASATTAAPSSGNDEVQVFRDGLVGSLHHLNPLLARPGSPGAEICNLIFEGLTRYNERGEPVPSLASNWLIAEKGLEYVVMLREDVLWQDGVPFSAVDVAFTLSLLQAPDFPGDAALGRFWRTVETEVLAANVLRFRLSQPLGSFLDRLRIPILPWHALQDTPPDQLANHPFNLAPVGTGPWQLEALGRKDDGEITLVDLRPAATWAARESTSVPLLDRMRFRFYPDFTEALRALQAGAIDGLAAHNWQQRRQLASVAQSASLQMWNSVSQTLGTLVFNWQREEVSFFRDQRVRLALVAGMEREAVVERALQNRAVPVQGPMWPGSWGLEAQLDAPATDLDAARWLLETARSRDIGTAPDAGNTPLSFSILTPDDPALVNLMREFAGQWARVGIDARVVAEPVDRYRRHLMAGDFDAALVELTAGSSSDPDPYAFWHEGQHPAGLNFGGVDDRRISELLERARREPHQVNRAQLYREFQQDFVRRAIAIPLYVPLVGYATSGRVTGVQLGLATALDNRFVNLHEWALDTS